MKMHGLGDLPYWAISYFYFLAICCIYMLAFIIFGSVIGKVFFLLQFLNIKFEKYPYLQITHLYLNKKIVIFLTLQIQVIFVDDN